MHIYFDWPYFQLGKIHKGIYTHRFHSVAVGHTNRRVALRRFSYKRMYGHFAGYKKVVITRKWPYKQGDCNARFHCSSILFYRLLFYHMGNVITFHICFVTHGLELK